MSAADFIAELKRYADLIRPMLSGDLTFNPTVETASAIQIDRGLVYPIALMNRDVAAPVDRLIEISTSERLHSIAIVDGNGHHRPVYRPLLVYSWLQAFRLLYEKLPRSEFGRWEEGLRPWCDLLEAELGEVTWPNGPMPAAHGAAATESAWIALALHLAGKVFVRDAWTDLASDTFGKLTRSQNSDGTFLLKSPSDNPESHWYDELVLLHAAASYAVQSEDRTLASAVARNANFHQSDIQPDHATSQPWGVFALIWNPPTRPLAEQMLHATSTNNSNVSLMLLADALYCIQLFTK